jgi:hypothetical protein
VAYQEGDRYLLGRRNVTPEDDPAGPSSPEPNVRDDSGVAPPAGRIGVSEIEQEPAVGAHSGRIGDKQPTLGQPRMKLSF